MWVSSVKKKQQTVEEARPVSSNVIFLVSLSFHLCLCCWYFYFIFASFVFRCFTWTCLWIPKSEETKMSTTTLNLLSNQWISYDLMLLFKQIFTASCTNFFLSFLSSQFPFASRTSNCHHNILRRQWKIIQHIFFVWVEKWIELPSVREKIL